MPVVVGARGGEAHQGEGWGGCGLGERGWVDYEAFTVGRRRKSLDEK